MKQKIEINCYKFAVEVDLKDAATYFKLPFTAGIEYLTLKSDDLERLGFEKQSDKMVWIFSFGCICLVEFEEGQVRKFLRLCSSLKGFMESNLWETFNDRHFLELQDGKRASEQLIKVGIYTTILAKSTELKYLEYLIDKMIDQTERFIIDLNEGSANPGNLLSQKINFGIGKAQLNIIGKIKLLNRPKEYEAYFENRKLYDSITEYYELNKRFNIIQEKIRDLISIISSYQQFGINRREKRLLILEIILLILFPVSELIHLLWNIL